MLDSQTMEVKSTSEHSPSMPASVERKSMTVANKDIAVSGRLVRTARLRAEYYEFVDEPDAFIRELKESPIRADIFSFLQRVSDPSPQFPYHMEHEAISALRISTFDHWWKSQINDKTRNMVRRAQKKGAVIRTVEYDDHFVKGIKEIYDEAPIRQGKPFLHYGKDLATLKKDHASFPDRSEFIGAFFDQEMIGFIKLVHGQGVSNCMQIISKVAHRDKAPMNALLSRAVEICAERKVPLLHYGLWSRRGLGDFKKHHAFERLDVCRYFVPLSLKGKLAIASKLHRKPADLLPEKLVDILADLRTKWAFFKLGNRQP